MAPWSFTLSKILHKLVSQGHCAQDPAKSLVPAIGDSQRCAAFMAPAPGLETTFWEVNNLVMAVGTCERLGVKLRLATEQRRSFGQAT